MANRWDKLGNVELVVLLALMRLNELAVRLVGRKEWLKKTLDLTVSHVPLRYLQPQRFFHLLL